MSYLPRSLDQSQQARVLKVWDEYLDGQRKKVDPPMPLDELSELMDIRKIIAEPPTERAPKSSSKKAPATNKPAAPSPKS